MIPYPFEIQLAGLSLIVGLTLTAISVGAAVFAFLQKPPKQDNMKATGLDGFGITQAQEGSVLPLLYGVNRVTGNLLYYGGLETTEVYQTVSGGKGGGSQTQLTGYNYRLDIWQSIGHTSESASYIDLVGTYVDDELKTPEAGDTIYNNGTTTLFPSFVPKGGKLPNVAHIGYEKLFLGENRTQLPVIHFLTRTYLSTGLPFENHENGNNPGAIIYDLLIISGVTVQEIDSTSFSNACTYWDSVGYYCSIQVNQVSNIQEIINNILQQFPGFLFVNSQGKFTLRPHQPNPSVDFTMVREDYYNFSMQRQTYNQINNDFSAKYIDKDLDFTERNVAASNDAVISLVGERKVESVDLSYFRTSNSTSRRIDEIMKNRSFPKAIVSFSTNLKYYGLEVGHVIDFSNDYLGFESYFLRVTSINKNHFKSNEIAVEAEQITEKLFDSNYIDSTGSTPSTIGNQLPQCDILDFFQFPYNPYSKENSINFALVERIFGTETSFNLDYALSRTPVPPATEPEYFTQDRLKTFSCGGVLAQDYNYTLPKDNGAGGIVFTPNYSLYPDFVEEQLENSYISNSRYLLIGSEILTFAKVEPIGGGDYRITGLQRGVFSSYVKSTYLSGTSIILFLVGDNIISGFNTISNSSIQAQALYIGKLQTPPLSNIDKESDKHSIMAKAPTLVEVTKTGTSLSVETYPTIFGFGGFGSGSPNSVTPRSTREMGNGGKYRIWFNKNTSGVTEKNTVDFVAVAPTSGAVEFNLQKVETIGGEETKSQPISLQIGAADGFYKYNNPYTWHRKEFVVNSWKYTYLLDFELA